MPSAVVASWGGHAWVRSCRFVTHAGNARSFPLCLLDTMIVAAEEAYADFTDGDDSLKHCGWGIVEVPKSEIQVSADLRRS